MPEADAWEFWLAQAEKERDEARALADLAIERLTWMQHFGVAADLAKRRTWKPAAAPSAGPEDQK